jgi:hypothetical protein
MSIDSGYAGAAWGRRFAGESGGSQGEDSRRINGKYQIFLKIEVKPKQS